MRCVKPVMLKISVRAGSTADRLYAWQTATLEISTVNFILTSTIKSLSGRRLFTTIPPALVLTAADKMVSSVVARKL